MNDIDPKWGAYLGLAVIIEQGIGHGTVSLTNLIPADWAPYVTSWANFLAFVGTSIMTYQAAVSAPNAGPLVNVPTPPVTPTIVKVLLVALALSFLLAVPSAQAQSRPPLTGNIVRDIAAANPSRSQSALTGNPLGDIIGTLDVKLLPDLQYALKLANASGSKVTGPCYQAWIDIINVRQKAVSDDQGAALPMPDPHLVTDFEKLVELRNSLQPDSEFMIKCSPVASMVKKDIVGFIGVVISGGTGLATLVPGL
jgi:hypothetical protein